MATLRDEFHSVDWAQRLRMAVHCIRSVAGAAVRACLGVTLAVVATIPASAAAQPSAAPSSLRPGDIVVVAEPRGQAGPGTLVKVDPSTGAQTTLSDFGDPSQGPTPLFGVGFFRPILAIEDATAIFRIACISGNGKCQRLPAGGARPRRAGDWNAHDSQ